MNPPIWFHWRRALAEPPVWNADALRALLARLDAPPWSFARVQSGTSAIQDFCAPLISNRAHESDYQFVERALATLFGEPASPALRSRYLELVGRGVPRDRAVEQVLTSAEFRARYLTAGGVTIDQRITSEP